MSTHSISRRRWLRIVSIAALMATAILSSYLLTPTSVDALPPRPTPAITPTATPTSALKPPKPTPLPLRLSHIRLVTAPVQDGLWTVVEWQGADGAWHTVEGWRGFLDAGSKRWAVYERNFGDGPFRWAIYDSPAGTSIESSDLFHLPRNAGEELIVRVVLSEK